MSEAKAGGRDTRTLLAAAGTILAILACYGTLLLVAALSALGVTFAINEGAWASAIVFFALLATAGLALGWRQHQTTWPLLLGGLGLALILWAMFASYSPTTEFAAFAALAVAAAWDWRARRAPPTPSPHGAVAWIEPDELRRQRESGKAQTVLDVRGPDEFTGPLGHIPGALNIPLGELDERLGDLRLETNGAITVVCRTDRRSSSAQATLSAAGFGDVTVLRGGMERWNALGFETIRSDIA
ncbi:MAG: uncharacterized protein K0S35_2289 [Geminicoccaceae bacterium]|nr:uncharacterized protein [Geminicoccaceae bacterium]